MEQLTIPHIFAPDYNPIKTEKFGKVDSIEMKNVWNVIEYSKISDACKVLESLLSNAEDKWYFKQFQKALNVHSEQSLNYYREMQIRMRKLFN